VSGTKHNRGSEQKLPEFNFDQYSKLIKIYIMLI